MASNGVALTSAMLAHPLDCLLTSYISNKTKILNHNNGQCSLHNNDFVTLFKKSKLATMVLCFCVKSSKFEKLYEVLMLNELDP